MECDRPIRFSANDSPPWERGQITIKRTEVVIKLVNNIYIYFDERDLHFQTVNPLYPTEEDEFGHSLTIPWNANFTLK
jgi:hypothetical protein